MQALIVYDSNFGNTRLVAEEMAKVLGEDTKVIFVKNAKKSDLDGINLFIIGSPINGWRPTEATTKYLDSFKTGELKGIRATTFDTRVKLFIHGDAKNKMAAQLRTLGAIIFTETEKFYVDGKEGPLLEGELARARKWAQTIKLAK